MAGLSLPIGTRWRLALATVLLLSAAVVVLHLRIGPVVATISPGRGVHSGDFLGLLPAGGALLVLLSTATGTPLRARWIR